MQTEGFLHHDRNVPETPAQQDRARIKETILRELPHADRLLLVLWHAEEMSPEEISVVLSTPECEVVATHERIISQLNAALAPARASA